MDELSAALLLRRHRKGLDPPAAVFRCKPFASTSGCLLAEVWSSPQGSMLLQPPCQNLWDDWRSRWLPATDLVMLGCKHGRAMFTAELLQSGLTTRGVTLVEVHSRRISQVLNDIRRPQTDDWAYPIDDDTSNGS